MISVVIPIYQVEDFLVECVNSVINQTYKDLQIILVDDGSKDNCGKIIDEYAKKDKRIIALHKPNGGLSDARNYGYKFATGEYVTFIDSDDFIDENMIEILYKNLIDNNADISIGEYFKFTNEIIDRDIDNTKIKTFNNLEALEEMFKSDSIGWDAWGKLYKTELFKNIEYPVGKICEDKLTTYKTYYISSKIVYSKAKLYGYRIRQNSISNAKSEKFYIDSFQADRELINFFDVKGLTDLSNIAHSYMVKHAFFTYCCLHSSKDYKNIITDCINILSSDYKYIKKASYLNFLIKEVILFCSFFVKHKVFLFINIISIILYGKRK